MKPLDLIAGAALFAAVCISSALAFDTETAHHPESIFRQPEIGFVEPENIRLECGRLPQADPDRQPELWIAVRQKSEDCAFEEYTRQQAEVWEQDPTAGVVLEP